MEYAKRSTKIKRKFDTLAISRKFKNGKPQGPDLALFVHMMGADELAGGQDGVIRCVPRSELIR